MACCEAKAHGWDCQCSEPACCESQRRGVSCKCEEAAEASTNDLRLVWTHDQGPVAEVSDVVVSGWLKELQGTQQLVRGMYISSGNRIVCRFDCPDGTEYIVAQPLAEYQG